jgi:hypothetical protein
MSNSLGKSRTYFGIWVLDGLWLMKILAGYPGKLWLLRAKIGAG